MGKNVIVDPNNCIRSLKKQATSPIHPEKLNDIIATYQNYSVSNLAEFLLCAYERSKAAGPI